MFAFIFLQVVLLGYFKMKNFFSFMATFFGVVNNPKPNPPGLSADKNYWEKPWQSNTEDTEEDSSRAPKSSSLKHSRRSSEKGSTGPCLWRSMSFSSPAPYVESDGACVKSLVDTSVSPSRCSSAQHSTKCTIHSQSLTPERLPKSRRHDSAVVQKTLASDNIDSPRPSENYHGSSGNSPYSSLVPLRCRAARDTHISNMNEVLDFYIHREQQEREICNQRISSNDAETSPDLLHLKGFPSLEDMIQRAVDCCLSENRTIANSQKPPRAYFTAPSSPTCSKENLRFHSFGESKDFQHSLFIESDLNLKIKEVKKRLMLFVDIDNEAEKFQNDNISKSSLLEVIKENNAEQRYLARELLRQMQCRIAERFWAREALKEAQLDLDTRTRRLEKEKNELQSVLEKELDRRSNDWSLELEKFQVEEQRLRERVRELAEQNVSLQREVSSLCGREEETRTRILNLEMQLNDLTASLDEVKVENQTLRDVVSELQKRSDALESEKDRVMECYCEKFNENSELQNVVIRLQRICSENEKTIAGLREGCSHEVIKLSTEGSDFVKLLQLEQYRLTGVEQSLRKEIDTCRHELESLRGENIYLLDCIKNVRNDCGTPLIRLEKELQTRVECLQNQGLSLLRDNSEFCGKLLEFVKILQFKHGQEEINGSIDGYYIVEFNMNFQSLTRGFENFKRSLQTAAAVLDEKSHLEPFECQSQETGSSSSKQGKSGTSKVDFELEFKAETLLTRVLREKLFSMELELERLQCELSSSLRSHEVYRSVIQQLRDDVCSVTQQAEDMEIQISRKDENFNQLEKDMEECSKELAATKGILPKVSQERDCLREAVEQSKERDMLLNYEVTSLKKKIESLEEDILFKEGQITILKDSHGPHGSNHWIF